MFESVNGRTDRRLECHTISSPGAFGSGELKTECVTRIYIIVGGSAISKPNGHWK